VKERDQVRPVRQDILQVRVEVSFRQSRDPLEGAEDLFGPF